jgi:hypothetical protein
MDDSHPSAHYYFLFGSDDTYARRSPSIFNNDLGSARAKEREKSAQWSLGPVLNVFMLESSAQEALYGIEFSHGERFEFFISRTCTHKSKRGIHATSLRLHKIAFLRNSRPTWRGFKLLLRLDCYQRL